MENYIELIELARNGSEVAFNQLCEQYKNLIDGLSSKYSAMCSGEYSSYDDFAQEAKLAFYKAVMKYDVGNNKVTFGAFAKVCVRNRLISCVRRHNSKKRRKGENGAEADTGWSLQDTVVRRELGEKLISVAERSLSKYENKVFMYSLEGRGPKEISSIIGKSEKSVNNTLYRIRLKLKKTVDR